MPTHVVVAAELTKDSQEFKAIVKRMLANEVEQTVLETEFKRKKEGLVLEAAQLAQELNDKSRRRAQKAALARQAVSYKRGGHRTQEQQRDLETRTEKLLAGSAGLTVTAIARDLHLHGQTCHKLLRGMMTRKVVRRVRVNVTFGRGMVRKMTGYALPLKAVAGQEKTA